MSFSCWRELRKSQVPSSLEEKLKGKVAVLTERSLVSAVA